MTLTRALVSIAISTVVCTAGGVAAGAALGHWCPNYYQTVLRPRPGLVIDPVQVGVGFGLNAGAFTGVLVGIVVVAIVAYFELRVRLEQIRTNELYRYDPEKG
jgi:hypothetical protein